MENILEGLNAAQSEAVTTTEGFVRVIAGAGSGKTRALSRRFAYLVNEIGILPGNILCVTFTNKAANEMRQRIHNLTGDNDTGYVNTFHGFCVSILQEDSYAVQYPKSFLVLDNSDIDAMLAIIYEERGLTLRNMTFGNARDMIEIQKMVKKPEYYLDMITMSLEVLHEKYLAAQTVDDIIFYGYLYQQKKCFGLDYNDLIKFTLYIFHEHEDIRRKWQSRLEYIMIDEFQDIDRPQYELMSVLCQYHRNLFLVGDPDQTIYTWRGADIRYLMEFDKAFPDVHTVMMTTNYRSTKPILDAANCMIAKNQFRIPKDLISERGEGKKVVCHFADTGEKEAKWIAGEILRLSGEGVSRKDITVLYRAHYVTRPLEEVFLKEKIPYTIYSGVPFFGRMEIKDALSYLRMIVYKDDLSFTRVVNTPKRNIGEQRMRFLKEKSETENCSLYEALKTSLEDKIFQNTKAADFVKLIEEFSRDYEKKPVSEILSSLLDRSGYEEALRTEGSQERLDNLAELKQSVYEYETSCGEEATLEQYIHHIALFSNTDLDQEQDKIKLMTVHSAKGLEFPHVFLCGMNEGVFPSRKVRTVQGMEEERRLAFVAMTRAMDGLYLSEAGGRNFDGSPRYPSRFLLEIDEDLLAFTSPPPEGLIQETKAYITLTDRMRLKDENRQLLPPGTRVRHKVFGAGEILSADEDHEAYLIRFDSVETPRTISFRIPLEILGEEG